ncbi:hypothetical protein AGMMS50293_20150 [Spirochaetia bacterium]|nr:hypothetical protein AGMMS50293_20150 [Spirochaetia bacterium]
MAEKSLVADWLRHANNDLITAKHMFDDVYPKQTEISAFHSQQCAEKALKAFLYANEIPFPWIHDLVKLIRLCKDVDQSFSEIEIECGKLNPYGTITRYPIFYNILIVPQKRFCQGATMPKLTQIPRSMLKVLIKKHGLSVSRLTS